MADHRVGDHLGPEGGAGVVQMGDMGTPRGVAPCLVHVDAHN
jgi:hypothetical protein